MSRRRATLLLAPLILAAFVMAMAALRSPATGGPGPSTDHATTLPAPPTLAPEVERLTRRDAGEGGARVAATWLTPDYLRAHPDEAPGLDSQLYLVFRLEVDSPTLAKMSVWDLKGMIFFREEGGREYGTPVWHPSQDGSRKVGIAAFPRTNARGNPIPDPRARYFELVVRDLAGVKERVLRWESAPVRAQSGAGLPRLRPAPLRPALVRGA
ncbi:MAG: hypothetical protein ACM3US_05760 [Sphingomonadaceae bacterium]